MGESILRDRLVPFGGGRFSDRPACRKGIGLIFPNQDVDIEWQHKRDRERRRGLRGEFSFLVNRRYNPGIGSPGDRVVALGKAITF